MPLQFLIGAGQNDSQEKMIQLAQSWTAENPQRRVFFLVPNYNKFEQELLLLSKLNQQKEKIFSTIQSQAFSFDRLAWFFLQKDGKIPGNTLSDAGSAMIFRKVLQEKKAELTLFRGEINKTGFIEQLNRFYQEMKLGNLTVEDFQLVQDEKNDQALKLHDLQLIYQSYEENLLAYHVQNDDPLQLLADYLSCHELADDLFIVSGFAEFTARELQVLQQLMTCSELVVSLTLDRPQIQEMSLFYQGQKTYQQLKRLADLQQVPVKFDLKATEKKSIFNQLGHFWQDEKVAPLKSEAIQIWQAPSLADEVRQVGNEIRKLVQQGYRYREIQVLIRDFERYEGTLVPLFAQLEIPIYLDQNQVMVNHPLIEFLEALFAVDTYHYRINDVFRLLRTELFVPFDWQADNWQSKQQIFRTQIDQCENACLAYNFKGSRWTKAESWQFVDEKASKQAKALAQLQETAANTVRLVVQQCLPAFFEKIKAAHNGQQAAEIFYHFLEQVGVKRQLLFWRDQEVARGELEKARNHEQTWQAFVALLDEYVLIYGEEEFSWLDFQAIFLAGLQNLDYGKIPTAIDQVNINDLELARIGQAKVTFALGLNSKTFPARFEDQGLLSPEEREQLNAVLPTGKFLPAANSSRVNDEPYLAYTVFLSATDKLYLTYAASLDGEKRLEISNFLTRLSKGLAIPIKQRGSLNLTTEVQTYLGSWRTLLTDLNCLQRLAQDEHQPLPADWSSLGQLIEKSSLSTLAKRVFASLTALNVPQALLPETAEKMYGKNLHVSVSRIENFYNCQYKYFANFGLGLKERTVYGLTLADAGEFYHEALDRFFKLIHEQGLDLLQLTENQRTQLADQLLQQIFGEKRYRILSESARMNYIRYQLSETIRKVSWGLVQQNLRTDLKPYATEVIFGSIAGEKGIPGIDLHLNNGGELAIRGKIDRLDTLQGPESDYLSVIDYKSSSRSFDLVDAYYGLALQLITYLDVALRDFGQTKNVKPIGAYYLHVHNPVLKSAENINEEILKAYRYDGLFANDPAIFEQLDHSLTEGESSLIFPLKKDKQGQLVVSRAKDKFYTDEEIELLRTYNRQQILTAGNDLINGELKLNPAYKNKERIACQTCPFRSICKFDVMLKENNYHRLENLEKPEILERMKEQTDMKPETKPETGAADDEK